MVRSDGEGNLHLLSTMNSFTSGSPNDLRVTSVRRFMVISSAFVGVSVLAGMPIVRPLLVFSLILWAIAFNSNEIHPGWSLFGASGSLALFQWARHVEQAELAMSAWVAGATFLGIWVTQVALLDLFRRWSRGFPPRGIARLFVLQIATFGVVAAVQISGLALVVVAAAASLLFLRLQVSVELVWSAAAILALVATASRFTGYGASTHHASLAALGMLAAVIAPALRGWRSGKLGRWGGASLLFLIGYGLNQGDNGRGAALVAAYFVALGLLVILRVPWQPPTWLGVVFLFSATFFVAFGNGVAAFVLGQLGFFFLFGGCVLSLRATSIVESGA